MTPDQLPDEIIARRRNRDGGADEDVPNDELLVDHAKAVADRAVWLGRFESESGDGGPSDEAVVRCLGWLHDFGKVAPAFQLHVRGEYPDGKDDRLTYHARLGAFATYYALGQLGAPERDRLAAWGAVLRHHGRLPDFAERTFETVQNEQHAEKRGQWAGPQINHVQSCAPSRAVASRLLAEATDGAASWDGFVEAFESGALFDDLLDAVAEGPMQATATTDKLPADLYGRTTRLWSSLTLADKTAAADREMADALRPQALDLDRLESHIDRLQHESGATDTDIGDTDTDTDIGDIDPTDEASLNRLRETARQRVKANAPRLADAEVGTLTLPTGLGKTFAGITGAFELRDVLAERRGRDTKPTVVYALPYTSIIEQTRETFEDEDVFDADPRSREFTVHHYLAETVTYLDADHDETADEADWETTRSDAELLGESWRSGVVLTTFVQLFESLAGPTNGQGLKLPALRDAVVVLDEPQALPKRWWDAIRRLGRIVVGEYDARILSMTATQPTLFTDGDFETLSLLAANDSDGADAAETTDDSSAESSFERRASEAVARVGYEVHESVRAATEDGGTPISHADAAAEIAAATQTDGDESADARPSAGGRSVLAVCNTIGSSRALTARLETAFRATGRRPTHVGETYQSVLSEVDTNPDELPDYEQLRGGRSGNSGSRTTPTAKRGIRPTTVRDAGISGRSTPGIGRSTGAC
ncbi:CRISPR-associated endonuclease Cas3'' [Halorussus caseinilyticus]|uniref:CRISPR-associated endonuclease Cas3 n=1 Tax=Halorussus caseinilyticus TaxID=3034025 RepID=A0ABD5WF42_9EURY